MSGDIYGPNTPAVTAFIERLTTLTPAQVKRLNAAGDAAWYAARTAAWDAAWAAAGALVVRDLITPEQFATLVAPFVDAGFGAWFEETPA